MRPIRKPAIKAAGVAVVALIVAGGSIAAAHGHGGGHRKHHGHKQGINAVQAAVAVSGTAVSQLTLSGTVSPTSTVTITPALAGHVSTVDVTAGQQVSAGQTLFTTSSPTSQAQLAASQAGVAVAQAQLNRAQVVLQGAQQAYQNALAAQAAAAAATANGTPTSGHSSPSSGGSPTSPGSGSGSTGGSSPVSGSGGQTQSAASLQNAVDQAVSAVNQAQAGVSVAQATLNQANAQAGVVQATAAGSTVTAPISGLVASVTGVVGESVTTATPVMQLESGTMNVLASLSQQDVALVKPGQSATIQIPGGSGALAGSVASVSPVANTASLSFSVTVTLSTAPAWVHNGESATVNIATRTVSPAVLVPASAVVSINSTPQVFVVGSGHKVSLVNVAPSISDGNTTMVTGLSAGTEVVTAGQTYLASGDTVKVTSSTTTPSQVTGSSIGGLLTAPATAASAGGTAAAGAGSGRAGGGGSGGLGTGSGSGSGGTGIGTGSGSGAGTSSGSAG